MTPEDLIILITYSFLLLIIGYFIAFFNRQNKLYVYFLPGLILKIIGAIAFCMLYKFYYGYGDSLVYFWDSEHITKALINDTINGIRVMFQGANTFNYNTSYITYPMFLFDRENDTFLVVKFAAIINLFTFSNYFGTTLVFSFLSYFGIWKLFETINHKFPEITFQSAFAILFFPSVFFWGSGLMKDTLVIGFLGYLIHGLLQIIEYKNFKLNYILMVISSFLVIFIIKAYVIISLLPPIVLWWIMHEQNRIKNMVVKIFIFPFLLLLGVSGLAYSLQTLGKFTKSYSIDNVISTAETYQRNHYGDGSFSEEGQGSGYTLGTFDPSIMGILSKFPAAVNVTLFRPYIWEVRNPVMLLSALESSLVLGITIYIVFGLGIRKTYKILSKNPFLTMGFVFAIFFSFAIGFSTYNFGALARYKIPCVPFYLITLFVLSYEIKKQKAIKWKFNNPKNFKTVFKN